jgi:outer membrane protein TolC
MTAWIAVTAMSGYGALSGCSTFSSDGGFDRVADATRASLHHEVRWQRSADERAKAQARVAVLLAQPLEPEDAVQIALLDNHALQASFHELGISEADLVQSGRPPNPQFTLRHASGSGFVDIEGTLTFNVLSLITAPYLHAAEQRRFAQVQDAIVIQIVQLADRTRTAYYTSLAARDSLKYAWQVKIAAETAAEIAHRMLGAGNWSRTDQYRQQNFYTQALQQLARAQLADDTARTELNRLLGIGDGGPQVQLAAHLPALPENYSESPDQEQAALQNRIDLKIMRTHMDELARRLKLTRATRMLNVLDVGPTRVREGASDPPHESGYEVSLEVPIFDTGDARVHKAEAIYAQSVEEFAQAALDAQAQIHVATTRYRTAYTLASRQHDDIMRIAKRATAQDLLRYNASQISVFDLLADARAQIDGVNIGIETLRDFWIAKSHLDTALIANSSDRSLSE